MAHRLRDPMSTDSMSTGDLVGRLSEQMSRLVRDELRLARLEMTEKGRHVGIGAGLFGGAGLVAFFGAAALLTAVVLLLAEVLPPWAAAAIVGVVLLVGAALLSLAGKRQVSQGAPPTPVETLHSVKADFDAVKEKAHR